MNRPPRHSSKFFGVMLVAILTASLFISEAIVAEAETVDPSTFRDLTLLSGQNSAHVIDGDHNTVWSVSFNGWDKEMLPNGNMLICANALLEINTTTKEVVWHHETGSFNYDADRLDTVLPTVNILSPAAAVYDGSVGVPISLSCDDPWYDEMAYRIYDETAGQWLTDHNVTYGGATEVFLENQRTYTLYAWAKDLVMEGGACPTSRAIVQLEEASVQFSTGLDETAPEISDVDVTAEDDITFSATVTDDSSGVKQVTLDYVYVNDYGTENNNVGMTNVGGDVWSAVLAAFPSNTTLTYTITAEDNAGNTATMDEMEYDYTIPEFSSWLLPSLLLAATLVTVIRKKKLV